MAKPRQRSSTQSFSLPFMLHCVMLMRVLCHDLLILDVASWSWCTDDCNWISWGVDDNVPLLHPSFASPPCRVLVVESASRSK